MLTIGILLIITFLVVILTNVFTRVDNTTISYDKLPDKFKMKKDSKYLKLYIIYPKSLVTKSSFSLYIIQICLFFVVLVLFIVQCATNVFTEQNSKTIGIIYVYFVVTTYILSFGFDGIVQYYYKNKK